MLKFNKKIFSKRLVLLFIILIHTGVAFQKLKQNGDENFTEFLKKKAKILEQSQRVSKERKTECIKKPTHEESNNLLHRYTRDVTGVRREKTRGRNAAFFSGRELLRLRLSRKNVNIEIPRQNFTVETWVKPAGGQVDPATIIGIYDVCTGKSSSSGWSIGIGSSVKEKYPKPKFYVWLKTERSPYGTWLYSNAQYIPDKWYHIALSYDGEKSRLFINGAMLSVSLDQSSDLFPVITSKCKEIYIGGNFEDGTFFRGIVDSFRIWNTTIEHNDLVKNMNRLSNKDDSSNLVFQEKFDNLKWWRKLSMSMPKLIASDKISTHNEISIKKPPCGQTVCDDPILINGYLENHQLRNPKEIRYRLINVMEDNGTNPLVTREQILIQHRMLLDAFRPYNISWKLEQHNVWNTTLRQNIIMLICSPFDVGDRICNPECSHSRTGNDGGDCEPFLAQCDPTNIGNGRCDFECNKEYHFWDRGDCCQPGPFTHITCFDPASPHRGYLGINEFKELVGLDGSSSINIFFASYSTSNLIGLATMPWDKDVYSTRGGVVVFPENFGTPGKEKGLVHELGHVLGLWHVHHGVSEMECSDPCLETEPSLELGDLCSDTKPTPNNTKCHDPDWAGLSCGIPSYTQTPFRNYMSYGEDYCIDHFTPQQTARMHCYIDLVYQSWRTSKDPAPVPVPPQIMSTTDESVTLAWLTPFNSRHSSVTSLCDMCSDYDACSQFASISNSSHSQTEVSDFSAEQAEGPPDANKCDMSVLAWMPDTDDVDECRMGACFIDLGFAFPVIPTKLSVWVVWSSEDGISDIELYFTDGTTRSLGSFSAFCDIELSVKIDVKQAVRQIRIYVSTPYVAIDAVRLSTENDYRECMRCRSTKYRITRNPSFSDGSSTKQTKRPEYVDRDVVLGQNYTYFVRVQSNGKESVRSPDLLYTHGQAYCGDGNLNTKNKEECDDGNLAEGDGCNAECKIEESFYCRGSPSACFLHDGDGICEDFERKTSVSDCGFYTPEGFEDQWVMSAVTNPFHHGRRCPVSLLTGAPSKTTSCSPTGDWRRAWFPCEYMTDSGNYWIEAYFAKAVVAAAVLIHLGSDGRTSPDTIIPLMRVELIAADNASKPLSVSSQKVSCKDNPITLHIKQDLAQPMQLTIGVRIRFGSKNISITGIRMRSPLYWNPIRLSSCTDNEVYNPRSGRCVPKLCSSTCGLLNIDNGQAKCDGYREGDICKVKCAEGYQTTSVVNEYTCVNGTWHSVSPASCRPLQCAKPEVSFASVACPSGTSYGSVCMFKCNPPAKLKGTGTTLRCEKDGHWSLPTSYCQILCGSANRRVKNAKLLTKSCKRGTHFIGKKCKFKCLKGYHAEGRQLNRRNVKLYCEEDGQWRGEKCGRIRCPPIEPKFTGLYTCTDYRFGGSSCTIRCQGETPQKIKCTYDGVWTGSFTMCQSVMNRDCPLLQDTNEIDYACNNNYIGYQCEVGCFLRNFKPVSVERTNKVRGKLVGSGGQGNDIPVTHLTCTALSQWLPDPTTLRCLEMCDQAVIQDGWCDPVNNREKCDWDGGDCCKSTSITGTVLALSDSCVKDCACLDPEAKENKLKKKKKRKKKQRRNRRGRFRHRHLRASEK